jgi:Fic family protein
MNYKEFIIESNKIENINETDWDNSPFLTGQRNALAYAIQEIRFPIQMSHILQIHNLLMSGTGLEDCHVGRFRNCNVYVGGFVCPNPYLIKQLLEMLLIKINNEADPLTCHYEFEYIHPFVDGNGRTGRILLLIHEKLTYGEPRTLIKFKERQEYYNNLSKYHKTRRG